MKELPFHAIIVPNAHLGRNKRLSVAHIKTNNATFPCLILKADAEKKKESRKKP